MFLELDLLVFWSTVVAKKAKGRPPIQWTFNYEDLARLSDKSVPTIQRSKNRPGGFDPENLESVLLWLARNARPDLKQKIVQAAMFRDLTDDYRNLNGN